MRDCGNATGRWGWRPWMRYRARRRSEGRGGARRCRLCGRADSRPRRNMALKTLDPRPRGDDGRRVALRFGSNVASAGTTACSPPANGSTRCRSCAASRRTGVARPARQASRCIASHRTAPHDPHCRPPSLPGKTFRPDAFNRPRRGFDPLGAESVGTEGLPPRAAHAAQHPCSALRKPPGRAARAARRPSLAPHPVTASVPPRAPSWRIPDSERPPSLAVLPALRLLARLLESGGFAWPTLPAVLGPGIASSPPTRMLVACDALAWPLWRCVLERLLSAWIPFPPRAAIIAAAVLAH